MPDGEATKPSRAEGEKVEGEKVSGTFLTPLLHPPLLHLASFTFASFKKAYEAWEKMGELAREQYVYDAMKKAQWWVTLTKEEMEHAAGYLADVMRRSAR